MTIEEALALVDRRPANYGPDAVSAENYRAAEVLAKEVRRLWAKKALRGEVRLGARP
jgi:hypothetical protein